MGDKSQYRRLFPGSSLSFNPGLSNLSALYRYTMDQKDCKNFWTYKKTPLTKLKLFAKISDTKELVSMAFLNSYM